MNDSNPVVVELRKELLAARKRLKQAQFKLSLIPSNKIVQIKEANHKCGQLRAEVRSLQNMITKYLSN